ncbi:MAG TPA: hypothetical protein ENJ10_01635 [Caldithrix abyssi]|uniref:PpiC domain-containing protein n=1 Tax=Caldithrix abyssi TaxID=187145 RepID=A0A7V1LJV9_CALAY|nr:hypothetical protein [Caldithrix abyssi]
MKFKGGAMRIVSVILLMAALWSCSHQNGFEKDSDSYNLAKKLSAKLEILNPDEDNVLATSDDFTVYASDVVPVIRLNFGKQADMLDKQPENQIARIIREFAVNAARDHYIMEKAAEKGIVITDADVDSIFNSFAARSGGEEAFKKRLAENLVDIDAFKKNIKKRETVNIFLKKLVEEETTVAPATLDSLKQLDYTASVRHILLKTQGMDSLQKLEVRKKMEGLLKRAKKGEDFAKLANKYSEDPGSNKKGGLYENFGRGQMVKPFEDAAFSVPIGGISDIVETAYGYHILKIEDRKKDTRPDQVIIDELKSQKGNQVVQKLFDEIKTEHNIVSVVE